MVKISGRISTDSGIEVTPASTPSIALENNFPEYEIDHQFPDIFGYILYMDNYNRKKASSLEI